MIDRLRNARGILFDLDNTLYPRDKGVFSLINDRINEYVRLTTGAQGDEVDLVRREYLKAYGTTLGGLMHHHAVQPDCYLDFVHDVPVEDLLSPDPGLQRLLGSIQLPMMIFTNGTRSHARRVLEALGVSAFFGGVCDLAATGYLGKPHREAFEAASALLGCPLDRTIFVDDLKVNVEAGGAAGTMSVHVNGTGTGVGDLQVRCVKELEAVFLPMPWFQSPDR